jgi:hypothetical protein
VTHRHHGLCPAEIWSRRIVSVILLGSIETRRKLAAARPAVGQRHGQPYLRRKFRRRRSMISAT